MTPCTHVAFFYAFMIETIYVPYKSFPGNDERVLFAWWNFLSFSSVFSHQSQVSSKLTHAQQTNKKYLSLSCARARPLITRWWDAEKEMASSYSRSQQQQQRAMPFQLFLEKMRQPSAAELVSGIKQFINTFVVVDEVDVGVDEEGKSENNSSNSQRDPAKDSEKIQRFLREYAEKFRRHSLWRNCSQEEVEVRSFFL